MRLLPTLTAALALTACGAEPRAVTADDPDVARIAAENNAFTLDVLDVVETGEPNTFLSPFSMNAALSMTYAGARGDTATEMEDVLHMAEGADHHGPMGSLLRDLSGDHRRDYTLHVANRIWAQQDEDWREDFLSVTAEDYGAPTELTDIEADPDGTRQDINGWVAEQTRDRIEDLLPSGSLDESTRMVLVNAIYFKADWADAFDEGDTTSDPFTRPDGSTVDVDMMHGTMEGVAVSELNGHVLAGLPYASASDQAEIRLWILLPDEGADLATAEADLTPEDLAGAFGRASLGEADLDLPRIQVRSKVELSPVLSGLGMPTAFTNDADFTGMKDRGGLAIDEVIHEAFVKMDESGTEAAAATAVGVRFTSSTTTASITVDRPYLFFIRDELSGAILFAGRITDPSSVPSGGPE